MAIARLAALAFERAVHGSVERIYRNGELVEERRKPSDRLLMWLLSHHDPVAYGWLTKPQKAAPDPSYYPLQHARRELPGQLPRLTDVDPADCSVEYLGTRDFDPYDEHWPGRLTRAHRHRDFHDFCRQAPGHGPAFAEPTGAYVE
jgi:hypothetical protein